MNPDEKHWISGKYWNGSFTVQYCSTDHDGNQAFLPCNNAEMTLAFEEMYQFIYSIEETSTICGCKVTKIIARSGNPYIDINLSFISYRIHKVKDPKKDGIVGYISLPFESFREDRRNSQ